MVLVEVWVVGRTIPSWRMIVEDELGRLKRVREFLRSEDKRIFGAQGPNNFMAVQLLAFNPDSCLGDGSKRRPRPSKAPR